MPENLVICISCVKSKQSYACTAEDMYTSPLFRGMLAYAKRLKPKKIFILSAKYGLLALKDMIEPYEKTLKNMTASERKTWANDVLERLRQEASLTSDKFIFLAGMPYRENLMPHIKNYEIPMKGMPLGQQLQWLKEQAT